MAMLGDHLKNVEFPNRVLVELHTRTTSSQIPPSARNKREISQSEPQDPEFKHGYKACNLKAKRCIACVDIPGIPLALWSAYSALVIYDLLICFIYPLFEREVIACISISPTHDEPPRDFPAFADQEYPDPMLGIEMENYLPQDEYFEWEDILVYRQPGEVSCREKSARRISVSEFSSSSRSSSPGHESSTEDDSFHWNDPESNLNMDEPTAPTSRPIDTSMSLQTAREAEKAESPINFPSYDTIPGNTSPECPSNFKAHLEDKRRTTKDDSDVYISPLIHVDYFSHDWCMEDIFASWRHLQTLERSSKNAARLENATWRVWAKLSSDLQTVSPQEIDWLKDIDDTCLYGPLKVSAHKKQSIMTINAQAVISKTSIMKACLKRPRISELLLQGSQFSWTGARISTATCDVQVRTSSAKRVVQFKEIVEQCISVETSRSSPFDLARSKSFRSRNTTIPLSPTILKTQKEEPRDVTNPNFWSPTTFSPPPASNVMAPSERLAELTWLGAEEEDELDSISPPPLHAPSTYTTLSARTERQTEIINDLTTKFAPIPPPTPARRTFPHAPAPEDHGYVPLSDSSSSETEDEDDLVAQYLFECDHGDRSDSFSMSASDTSSGNEDGTEEKVEFHVSGDGAKGGVVGEKRMMERMDTMKRSFYDQVLEEFNAGWE